VNSNPPMQRATSDRKTQRARILRVLIEARGAWVPLPEIMACAAQYNARIFELRRLGIAIENRTKEAAGVRHSWFRIANSPVSQAVESEEAKPKSTWDDRPRVTGLPLFDGARP
jgi:hypothetical protein